MWFLSCPQCSPSKPIWFMHCVPGVCGALVKLRDRGSEIQPLWSYHIWTYYLSSLCFTQAHIDSHVAPQSSEPGKDGGNVGHLWWRERPSGIINYLSTKICVLLWLHCGWCTSYSPADTSPFALWSFGAMVYLFIQWIISPGCCCDHKDHPQLWTFLPHVHSGHFSHHSCLTHYESNDTSKFPYIKCEP